MNNRNGIMHLTLGGFYIMLGIVLPMITHSLGAGNVILPMHIPVLLAGLTIPCGYAVLVGFATPVLSSLLTGMPVLIPMLPIMVLELTTYALVASLLKKKNLNVWICLIGAMIAGRLAAGIMAWLLSAVFAVTIAPPLTYVITAVTTGLPGIIIQIIIVPGIYLLINRLNSARMINAQREFFDEKSVGWDAAVMYDLKKIDRVLETVDFKGKRVLDVGAGTGILLDKMRKLGAHHITALDISPAMLDVARKNYGTESISYIVGDIMSVELEQKVDVCVAYSVWPHIFDKRAFFRNINRQLSESGQLLIAHSSSRDEVNKRQGSKSVLPPVSGLIKQAKRYGFTVHTCIENGVYCVLLQKRS